MKHPNPRLLIPLGVITLLGVGGWFVDRRRDEQRSVLSGFFETEPVDLASRVGGRVQDVLVREGDAVHAGQTLVRFEAAPAQAEAAARHAQAEQARAQAAEVQHGPRVEDIRRQDAAVREAEATLAKLRHGALPEEIDAARAMLRQAEAQVRKLRAGSRPEEIAQARAAERAAAAKLAQAERGLTSEERAQLAARTEEARAAEQLAAREVERSQKLFDDGAISRQQLDRVRTDLQSAQARLREAAEAQRRADLGTPREELAQARHQHEQAQAALQLALAGARAEDVQAAEAEIRAARDNLRLVLRGPRTEDIAAAQQRVAQARELLAALQHGSRPEEIAAATHAAQAAADLARSSAASVGERTLTAPRDGVVERRLAEPGDLVGAGTPVVRISDPNYLWIRVYVPEDRLARVKVGDPAQLTVDGVPGLIDAVVESIATQGEFTPANLQTPEERGRLVFGVRLRPAHPDARLKPGMYATIRKLGSLL